MTTAFIFVSYHSALEPGSVSGGVFVPELCGLGLLAALGHDLGLLDVPVRGEAGGEAGHHPAALAGDAGHGVRQVRPQVCELTKVTDIIWKITDSISSMCFRLLLLLPFKVTKPQRAEFILQ